MSPRRIVDFSIDSHSIGKPDSNRLKLSLILLGLAILCFSIPIRAQTSIDNPQNIFSQEFRRAVQKATSKRLGVVILADLSENKEWVFGEYSLLQEKFLPGSLVKLMTAEAALPEHADFQWNCPGHARFNGKVLHCWNYRGHGKMNLPLALAQSCNLYFARLAQEIGWERWRTQLKKSPFEIANHLAAQSHSDLTLAQWAIGDIPPFQVTPREVFTYWVQLLPKLDSPDDAALKQGLRQAAEVGTAKGLAKLSVEILAKTGTGDSLQSTYRTNGWLLGAYPADHPRWAWVIFLQEAHGFREPTHLSKSLIRLALKYGIFHQTSSQ